MVVVGHLERQVLHVELRVLPVHDLADRQVGPGRGACEHHDVGGRVRDERMEQRVRRSADLVVSDRAVLVAAGPREWALRLLVVVVEDLISTGKSSLQVVDVLRNAGIEVVGMVSIFNYGFDIAVNAFAEKNCRFISLTNYEVMIKLALEKGIIAPEMEEVLLQWKADPANWEGL